MTIVGFTAGAWDLLHPGHTTFLETCQNNCDRFIVGLHSNPTIDRPNSKNKPIESIFERYIKLVAILRDTDGIIPYDTEHDLLNILSVYNINKRFLGSDYKDKEYTGKEICTARNIEIVYIPRFHDWSSTSLKNRIKNAK